MATLAIDNDEIFANIGTVLGINTSGNLPPQTADDFDRIIRGGRRKLFLAYDWSFLQHDYPISTSPVTEITGSCVNGVITTADTIPLLMAGSYKLVPEDEGGLYDIASQTLTTITLNNTSSTLDFDSQTIKLYRYRYALPSNWAAFIDPIVVENWETSTQLSEYGTIPEFQLRGTLNTVNTVTGPPEAFAVTHDVEAETGTVSPYLLVYPLLETGYVLKTRIRIQPGDALAEVGAVMHPIFSEILMEAILAQAEIMYGKQPQTHVQLYTALLPAAIKVDKQMRGTRRLLPREALMSDASRERIAIQRCEIDLTNALLP